jgi:hypothetical protein
MPLGTTVKFLFQVLEATNYKLQLLYVCISSNTANLQPIFKFLPGSV